MKKRKRKPEYWRRKKARWRAKQRADKFGITLSPLAANRIVQAAQIEMLGFQAVYYRYGFTRIVEVEMAGEQSYDGFLRQILNKAIQDGKELRLTGFRDKRKAIALRHRLYKLRDTEKENMKRMQMHGLEHPWEILLLLIRDKEDGTFELLLTKSSTYYSGLKIIEAPEGVEELLSDWLAKQQPQPRPEMVTDTVQEKPVDPFAFIPGVNSPFDPEPEPARVHEEIVINRVVVQEALETETFQSKKILDKAFKKLTELEEGEIITEQEIREELVGAPSSTTEGFIAFLLEKHFKAEGKEPKRFFDRTGYQEEKKDG